MSLRIALVLPGLGRVHRGAETAFLELASRWVRQPGVRVDAFGTGIDLPEGITAHPMACVPRERFERFPTFPALRSEYEWEELTFVLSLAWSRQFRANQYDIALHCSYPYVNWFLQRACSRRGPRCVFVTQNGDWPVRENRREYRYFTCDGLVCTNPEYHERHQDQYPCALIPNGVNSSVYSPRGEVDSDPRIPNDCRVVLMASALIPSKGVTDGVRAVARCQDLFLLVVGDGPSRAEVTETASRLLPGRHLLLGSVPRERMPGLYRRANLFLHMSQDEPFGIVYLEAAATGLPIVAHDGPNVRWILGDAARYVDTSNLSAVSEALISALDPGDDLGQRARARMDNGWSWDIQAMKYLAFLRRLCE